MFRQNTTLVWVGILALSGMFLMGQQTWGPDEPPGEFEVLPAALLSLGAEETVVYEGTNPLVALDTVTLEFSGDGTVVKTGKLPAPLGAQVATGTWAYDGMQLTLETEVSSAMVHHIAIVSVCDGDVIYNLQSSMVTQYPLNLFTLTNVLRACPPQDGTLPAISSSSLTYLDLQGSSG